MPALKSPSRRRVLLGEITSVHGIRGDVVIRSYTAEPSEIGSYGALEDESGQREFTLAVKRATDKGVIACVNGISDRTVAERLRGTKLYIARERLPDAGRNEYYHSDLLGLAAVDPNGNSVGSVIGIHNFGAGDIIEIRIEGTSHTEMLPFTHATVPTVDINAGRLVVVMQEAGDDEQEPSDP